MSKKKATMTLKDFHGGSIPSDLPLPSAPGVTVRPVDRGGFDRQMSWGNSVGRSDNRLRPASAGSARTLDEKTPFLSHSVNIGRNFDEDERKPLDGVSGPRRTVGDESIQAQPSRLVEAKIDNVSGARISSRPATVSASQISSGPNGSSYAGRVSEVHNARLNNQTISGSRSYGLNYPNMGGNAGQAVGSFPNAWGIRKETSSMKEPVSTPWSAPDAATKLAHASALEKVSSGRWNSKQHVHPLKDFEVFEHPETDGEFQYNANSVYNKKTYNSLDVVGDSDNHDVALVMHAERSLAVSDGVHGGGKEIPTNERVRSTSRVESYERNTSVAANGFQSLHPCGKSSGTEFQSVLHSESSERPKLKLLPRSKPLENSELALDYTQTNDHLHADHSYIVHEPKNPVQSGFAGLTVGDQAPERPKLNLKPRSQPLEQLEGNGEVKRGSVFGGARPRELVLKERGIEDDVNNYESQSPMRRMKEISSKPDTFMHGPPTHYPEKAESIPTDQRTSKYPDRRDPQLDGDRTDLQRRNRQNEFRRNNRDVEKLRNQQQKLVQDRPPSPETWRKPVEHAKPASPDAPPMRYGKAASAVELAQTFSKSVSSPTVADRFSGPSRNQMPFSRLMGPTPRPQINGY